MEEYTVDHLWFAGIT